MVSFSIKPGDQNDEIESPNLVRKTEELTDEYQSFFLLSRRCFEKFKMEGVAN